MTISLKTYVSRVRELNLSILRRWTPDHHVDRDLLEDNCLSSLSLAIDAGARSNYKRICRCYEETQAHARQHPRGNLGPPDPMFDIVSRGQTFSPSWFGYMSYTLREY
jgi:hypothetical protein